MAGGALVSRRKNDAQSPHFDAKVIGSGTRGERARKAPACPTCNRRMRRHRPCHLAGKYGHIVKGGFA